MTPRRHLAWVRLLCAFALGVGLSGTAVAAANSTTPTQSRSGIEQLQSSIHEVTAATTRAPLALSHHVGRHIPPSIGTALLGAWVLIGTLALAARRRANSARKDGRHASPIGARAPPVAIGS
jgi:hypothetical protein